MPSFSGLWNNEYGENYTPLNTNANTGNAYRMLGREFAQRLYGRASTRALIASLVDGVVGDNATATHKRVKAERDLENNVQGGVRTIETHTAINRNTVAADENRILAALALKTSPTYPVDKAGVGGGSKLGW